MEHSYFFAFCWSLTIIVFTVFLPSIWKDFTWFWIMHFYGWTYILSKTANTFSIAMRPVELVTLRVLIGKGSLCLLSAPTAQNFGAWQEHLHACAYPKKRNRLSHLTTWPCYLELLSEFDSFFVKVKNKKCSLQLNLGSHPLNALHLFLGINCFVF